jgi:hypothetical protein
MTGVAEGGGRVLAVGVAGVKELQAAKRVIQIRMERIDTGVFNANAANVRISRMLLKTIRGIRSFEAFAFTLLFVVIGGSCLHLPDRLQ